MSVYDEILEKKKQDRIRYELEQRKEEIKELDKEIDRRRSINYDLSLQIIDKDKEIERLTELCNKYEEEHKTTFETWQKDIKENELLHSTIKELREYCRNDNNFQIIAVEPYAQSMIKGIQRKLLEILDKESDNNDRNNK